MVGRKVQTLHLAEPCLHLQQMRERHVLCICVMRHIFTMHAGEEEGLSKADSTCAECTRGI